MALNETANWLSAALLSAAVACSVQVHAQDVGPDGGCSEPCAEQTPEPQSPEQLADEGARYATGQGVTKDVEHAAGLFRRACDQGSARACSNLGVLYHQGPGAVPRDDAQAGRLFTQACDQSYMPACYNLGLLYEPAENGAVRAVELFRRACQAGYQPACAKLPQGKRSESAVEPRPRSEDVSERCRSRDRQRYDKKCRTPREGIVSGYLVALDLGILTPSPSPKDRLSLGLSVTIAIRLGMVLWDQLVLDASYGGMLMLSDQTAGDEAGSVVSGDFFNFEGGYQRRFRPTRSQSIVIGLLAGYLHGLGDLSRSSSCDYCPDTPTKMNPSGANLSGFVRTTFGWRGRFAVFVRTRWFLTGDLLHELGAGFEVGLP